MSSLLNNPRHKLACRALYKAFLTHCQKLPTPTLQRDAAKHITKQFQKNKRIQAVKSVQHTLLTAYQHENIMRKAAAGDGSCVDAIQAHLDAIAAFNKPNPPKPRPPPPTKLTRLEKARLKRAKKEAKRLALEGSSSRKAGKGPRTWQPKRFLTPLLSSASGLPLLRRRGESTPQHVAMTIKNIIKLRQKRQDRQELLEDHLEYASGEDLWDAEIAKYITVPVEEKQAGTWAGEIAKAIKYLTDAMRRREEKSKKLADKFWNIEMKAKEESAKIVQERRRVKRMRARHNRGRRKALARQNEDVVREAVNKKWKL
ncbi:hypothetical protein EV426DRAFT_699546 [Tirmania nivea]|nr:hypothetical protein EV426DRAFT_699546 [Tirmania nivea]